MSLFHINEDLDCEIVNYHDICPNSFMPNYKLKFLRINFRSVEEARRRAVIIALLTYSIMSGPNVFVKLFSKEHLENSPSVVENIVKLWKLYGINESYPDKFIKNISK